MQSDRAADLVVKTSRPTTNIANGITALTKTNLVTGICVPSRGYVGGYWWGTTMEIALHTT